MNRSLLNAYFQATDGERNTKKYATKLASIWLELYPDKCFTGKHLIAQIKNIKTRKLLAPDEIDALRAEAMNRSPATRAASIRRSINRLSSSTPQQIGFEEVERIVPQADTQSDASLEIMSLFQEINFKWKGVPMDMRPRIAKVRCSRDVLDTVKAVDVAVGMAIDGSMDFDELCHMVYSAATAINTILETSNKEPELIKQQREKPPWEERLQKKVTALRKEIGILHNYSTEDKPSRKVVRRVQNYANKIGLKRNDPQYNQKIKIYSETLKQKIAALGSRLRRYNKRAQRYRQNNLFLQNQRKFFRQLEDEKDEKSTTPAQEKMVEYWSSIWSQDAQHNNTAPWITPEKLRLQSVTAMENVVVTVEDIKATVKRLRNWSSPGIDGVHNYWWKHLTSTHAALARLLQCALRNPSSVPEYFTQGITYMVPKKGDLSQPNNYRPITCLPSIYKILTSTISCKINQYLKKNNIMAWEQNGCKRKGRGSKELLVIDKELTKQAKKRKKNISIAWIDYEKAYDSVPHSWLVEALKIYKIDDQVIKLLEFLMTSWRTKIYMRGSKTEEIKIKRGIFQGDSLSPLWFCLAMNILSAMLNRSAYGYTISTQVTITHLFYMDDLKLFARGRKQLEGLLELVRRFSEDVGMSLGLGKCATVNVSRGRMTGEENIRLVDGREITEIGTEDGYRYLGIVQTYEIKHQENKEIVEKELFRRMHKILKTQLSSKNKIEAINIWALPSFTYTAGVINWSRTDLQRIDQRMRATLTKYGILHPNSAIERVHLPRKEGGRGLGSIEEACRKENESVSNFFEKNNHLPVHKWVVDQTSAASSSHQGTSEMEEEVDYLENLRRRWQTKALHGNFYSSLHQNEVDLESTNMYLMKGYLYPQTEGTLFAIQDQVVPTRNYSKFILKQQLNNTKCRLCDCVEETVQHLSSGCSAIADTKYMSRHNNMGKVVHQLLCLGERLLQNFTPYHAYTPQTLLENEHTKVYWDFAVLTDQGVEHNRPDMIVWYKTEKTAVLIDFSIPMDQNLAKAYQGKIRKYEPLARQIRDIWKLKRVDIVPLIISCNGLVHKKTTEHLKEMKLPPNTLIWMQKAVLLGTVNIIRSVLYPH
ncbi:uncharacterized protein LOC123319228 [Coccinella septempunctata]|uniref:uncharacterized protein LOC123319228 n=1 Tax=Coccinella septempunctata TaxID=41139 RepID=UPI001D06819C|nr:uncharacterized protein LOC123319228 [Coccinella septempunctata]